MYIKVRVKTAAKQESVEKISEDTFAIEVREKPKMNLANKKIVVLVARELGLPAAKVRIIAGHQHSSKILQVGD